jgi:hypothetical protein
LEGVSFIHNTENFSKLEDGRGGERAWSEERRERDDAQTSDSVIPQHISTE